MSTSPKAPGGSQNRGAGGAPRPSGGSIPKPAQQPKAPAVEIKNKKVDSEAPPPSEAVLSSRDFVQESDPPAGEAEDRLILPSPPTEAHPTSGRKLLESLPFFQVEAAPYDPRVPPLPTEPEVPAEAGPSSGLFDIRGMLAVEEEAQKQVRADDDLLNLSGGLFGGTAAGPIAPPDMKAIAGAGSTKTPIPAAEEPRAAASAVAAPAVRAAAPKLAPVITAVGPPSRGTKELAAAQRSARVGWVVALICGGAALVMGGLKLGQSFSGASNGAPSPSAATTSTAVPESTQKADLFPPSPRRVEEPSVDDSPLKAKTPGEVASAAGSPSGQALGHTPGPLVSATAGKGSGTSVPTGGGAAPTATAVATATAAPTEPSGGVEFNKTAARTALAMAAAAAAACKQPDDPSGGAKVSITFAPSGRVTSAKVVSPPFQGTPTGGCIASAFRTANVPPFDGDPITVTKDVSIR